MWESYEIDPCENNLVLLYQVSTFIFSDLLVWKS